MEFEKQLIEYFLTDEDYKEGYGVEDYIRSCSEELKKDPDRYRGYFINDPALACYFAYYVDKKPRDDMRKVACKTDWTAYYYAYMVDGRYHPDTWAVIEGTAWETYYITNVGTPN